jgi:hypothetical protein
MGCRMKEPDCEGPGGALNNTHTLHIPQKAQRKETHAEIRDTIIQYWRCASLRRTGTDTMHCDYVHVVIANTDTALHVARTLV